MNRSFYVAGVQFRPRGEIDKAVREMKVGDKLGLYPEPTNKFDPNAVKILFEPADGPGDVIFLGYVPKKFSSEVTAMMEIGADIECIVEIADPAAKTYEMIKVVIREVSDEADEDEDDHFDCTSEGSL